jgi:hypothetical protein
MTGLPVHASTAAQRTGGACVHGWDLVSGGNAAASFTGRACTREGSGRCELVHTDGGSEGLVSG